MLAVLGIPAIDRCNGDARGLLECLRGQVDDKFDLGLDPPPPAAPQSVAAVEPIVSELPTIEAAETLPIKPPVEATRSLAPQVNSAPPGVTQPQVIAAPKLVPTPDLLASPPEPPPVADPPLPEEPDPKPLEIALAAVTEPVAPSFVPPAPLVATPDGVPPDLEVAKAEPTSIAEPAPDFALPGVPDLPTSPPPDLVAAAVEPEVAAPSFIPPAAPVVVEGVPPDLEVAVAEPAPVAAPLIESPVTPTLPTSPAPDLIVAAVDPVVPAETPSAVAPFLAPSIDAVEIDGEGNFIAGNGPSGATMRLYVDGIPVGVSPVVGGRWLVEGPNLLTEEQQTLRVEAIDPLTGKVLGDATIVFEGPMVPEPKQPAAAIAPTEAPPADLGSATDQVEQPAQPEAVAEPPPVPPLTPVVPAGESASVTILGPSGNSAITTLATGNPSADAVVTFRTAHKSPAIMAQFTLPKPKPATDVTVLYAIPIGDPGAGRFVSGKAIIRRGDTLWDIAHRYYGSGVRYRTILRANRDLIARPGRIYPGQVFELPLVYDD
jgi:nucleoid-associated protein YgaU